MGRNRSNSQSSGSRTAIDIDELNDEYMKGSLPLKQVTAQPIIVAASAGSSIPTSPEIKDKYVMEEEMNLGKKQYTNIIVLKSLNDTFETKFLVVPYKPEELKLGRPVASGNKNGSTQIRPDNGNFDSRVLSRNHASLSCDPDNGKIYIRDLNSSNGTFVNGNRIDQGYSEIHVGDTIDLGTDIDAKMEHRKITAVVEDISIIPLVAGYQSPHPTSKPTETKDESVPIVDAAVKKAAIVESRTQLSNKATDNPTIPNNQESMLSVTTAQRAAFEAAMFGDVINVELDDNILGVQTEILSGIFVNSSIGTSPNLVNTLKTLATELAMERQESVKLKNINNFLVNFTAKIDYVKKNMEETNERYLMKLQESLRQNLLEKHNTLIDECLDRKAKLDEETRRLCDRREGILAQKQTELELMEQEMKEVEKSLEKEREKHYVLDAQKKAVPKKKDLLNDGTKNASTLNNITSRSRQLFIVGTVTVGLLAGAWKWLPWNSM